MRIGIVVVTLLAAAGVARAQTPNCEDDAAVGPNRVYMQAADSQVPRL